MYTVQGREQQRPTADSVAADIISYLSNRVPDLGMLSNLGLFSFHLYATALSASEPLAEHILVGAAFGRDANSLIVSTLKAIYTAPTGWAGNETLSAAMSVLRILASIQDEKQQDRISLMMECDERPAIHIDNGVGLMVAARAFYHTRSTQHYGSEVHYAFDRYVGVLKELLGLQAIFLWMTENRAQWTWMERDLLDHHNSHTNQMRGDYSGRREGDGSAIQLDHHQHSDSDMPGINDSEEEDDDDSRYEEMEPYAAGPSRVVVEGAGNPAVNGVYSRDGYFERACKYSRTGDYKGQNMLFSLFQCNVSNNTKHWYISIVPANGQPGTNTDVDFYSAPVTEACTELPPLTGWTKSNEGEDPPPKLTFRDKGDKLDSRSGREPVWNGAGGEDEDNHGGRYI